MTLSKIAYPRHRQSLAVLIILLLSVIVESTSDTCNIFNTGNKCNQDEVQFRIQFMTDDKPEETSWEIINAAKGDIEFRSNPYTEKWTFKKETGCLPGNSNICYVFALYDSNGDGLASISKQTIQIFYAGNLILEGLPLSFNFTRQFATQVGDCTSTTALFLHSRTHVAPYVSSRGFTNFSISTWPSAQPHHLSELPSPQKLTEVPSKVLSIDPSLEPSQESSYLPTHTMPSFTLSPIPSPIPCLDVLTSFYIASVQFERDCTWVLARKIVRCERFPEARENCPVTCGTCPTAVPSGLSSQSSDTYSSSPSILDENSSTPTLTPIPSVLQTRQTSTLAPSVAPSFSSGSIEEPTQNYTSKSPSFTPTMMSVLPTNEDQNEEIFDIIGVDSFGRRYFPKRMPPPINYTFPIVPECKDNEGVARCFDVPKYREEVLPQWVGKLHQIPPKCDKEKKKCQNGLPQAISQPLTNMQLKPVKETKFSKSDISELSGGSLETSSITMADVNNDGWVDIIIGNKGGGQVNQLLLGDGTGGFEDISYLPGGNMTTSSIAVADINNDGFLDIVIGNYNQTNLLLLANDIGVFEYKDALTLPGGSLMTTSIAVADVDNDGWLDIIIGNHNQVNQLLLNNGNGGYIDDVFELPGGSLWTLSVVVADVNNDRLPDIVVGNKGLDGGYEGFGKSLSSNEETITIGEVNQLLLNNGSGVFEEDEVLELPGGSLWTNCVQVADINNDGYVDIMFGNHNAANQLLLGSDYGGKIQYEVRDLPGGSLMTSSIAVADMNNDGWLDLVIANRGVNDVNQIMLGDGTGGFAYDDAMVLPPPEGSSSARTLSIAVADVNKDGLVDIVIGNDNKPNNFMPNFVAFKMEAALELPGNFETYALAVADVNQDGWLDIIIGNRGTPNWMLLGNDAERIEDEKAIVLPGHDNFFDSITRSIAVADVNNDGWLDMLVGNSGQENQLLLGDGTGGFKDDGVEKLPGGIMWTYSLVAADVNNDGWMDVVVGNFKRQVNQLILGDGNGSFRDEVVELPGGSLSTSAIAVADVNNDQFLDIIVGNRGNKVNQLLLGNGRGGFWNETIILPGGTKMTWSLAVADVNNDGWVDIIVGNYNQENQLLLGSERGFEDDNVKELPGGNEPTQSIEVADLNNDGWLDIVIGNNDRINQLLLGNGSGEFGFDNSTLELPGGSMRTASIAIGDLNNDGSVDLVIGNIAQRNIMIPSSSCMNGGAQIHSKSWCFSCPSFMGKPSETFFFRTSCTECSPDTVQNSVIVGQETCGQRCVNQIRDLGDDSCASCDQGSYFNTSFERDPDRFDTWNNSKCMKCPKGQFSDRLVLNECFDCRPGTYQPSQGSTKCLQCEAGKFQPEMGRDHCIPCKSGGFCNSAVESGGGFVPCHPGTYNELSGQSDRSACIECPNGKFNPNYGSNSSQACEPCPSGTFSNHTGSSKCVLCEEGNAQKEDGKTSCDKCEPGTYADNTGFKACIPCPYGLYSAEGSTTCSFCREGFYLGNNETNVTAIFKNPLEHCKRCPQNTTCESNITVERIHLNADFWRHSSLTTKIYFCDTTSKGCSGSRDGGGGGGYCHDGYEGPLCSVCQEKDKYFNRMMRECIPCQSNLFIGVFITCVALVGAILYFVVMVNMQRIEKLSSSFWWHHLSSRMSLKEKTKILISFFQILATFDDIYGVRLSDELFEWLNFLNFLSLDLFSILPLDCTIKSTLQRYTTKALWPFLLILFVALVTSVRKIYSLLLYAFQVATRYPEINRRKWFQGLVQWSIIVIYFTLPTVTKAIFDAIRCQAFEDSDGNNLVTVSYLQIDMSIKCNVDDSSYRKIMVLFGIVFTIWIVLIPLIILWLLKGIADGILSNKVSAFAKTLRFLWEDYEPTTWYWDVLDIYRKIFLIGLMMFIDIENGSIRITRLLIAAIVSVLYLCILLVLQPYQQKSNNYYALVTNFFLVCCFVLGIILQLCGKEEEEKVTERGERLDSVESSCSRLIGPNLNTKNASLMVLLLALGLLIGTMAIVCFLSVTTITAPSVRVLSTERKPDLELPEQCTHHVFVSHVWKTGQAKTHAIVRKVQLIIPGLKVWLDVDELDDNISKLEDYVEKSAVFVLYYSQHYFESWTCRRELYAAIKFDKPMILVYEGDDRVIRDMITECTINCEDNHEFDAPDSDTILKKLLGESYDECIRWLNQRYYSEVSMNQLCYRILKNLPHYQQNIMILQRDGIEVPGEIKNVVLDSQINILVHDKNRGCKEVANELVDVLMPSDQSLVNITDAEQYFDQCIRNNFSENNNRNINAMESDCLVSTNDISTIHENKNNIPCFLLLYLNDCTFDGRNSSHQDAMLSLVRNCNENNIRIVLVKETDKGKGACNFGLLNAKAPGELLKPPISLFNEMAVPLYTENEYRIVSLRLILCKMGAEPVKSLTSSLGSSFRSQLRTSNLGSRFRSQMRRSKIV